MLVHLWFNVCFHLRRTCVEPLVALDSDLARSSLVASSPWHHRWFTIHVLLLYFLRAILFVFVHALWVAVGSSALQDNAQFTVWFTCGLPLYVHRCYRIFNVFHLLVTLGSRCFTCAHLANLSFIFGALCGLPLARLWAPFCGPFWSTFVSSFRLNRRCSHLFD